MKDQTTVLEEAPFDPFSGPAILRVIHTTQAQEEIWAACNIGGQDANRAYNESISLILKGALEPDAIVYALETVVQRHESLRAVFSIDGRYMTILEQNPIELDYVDIASQSTAERQKAIANYLAKDADFIFDLVRGPLFKVVLIRVSESEHRLVITAHHIICDGWSFGIILQELGALYSAKVLDKTPELPEPESFGEFADEQHTLIASKEYDAIERFWLAQYQKSIPELNLPTDFSRPALRTYKSKRLDFSIDSAVLVELKKTGLKAGSSFVTTLMAAFEIFLYQQTGQENLVLGLPSAGQSIAGKTHLIGHCVNLLPIRGTVSPQVSFAEYLKQRKSNLFDVFDHQPLSFGHLLQKLAVARDPSRVPLVPVVFNIDLGMTDDVSFMGLEYELLSNPRAYEVFEIFLNASGSEEHLVLEWSYNEALFTPETIKKMMRDFTGVLGQLIAEPNRIIADLIEVDTSSYDELNATTSTYSAEPLHKLIAEQVLKTPTKTAIKFNDIAISYTDLQERANRLSHYFIEKGMQPGDFVGVCTPRSPELLTVLLAIMQCGGVYIPMDPTYPEERLRFMLEDSEARFFITYGEFSKAMPDSALKLEVEDFVQLDSYSEKPPLTNIDQSDLAYVIYTSGSTGKPKGVPVTHKNLVNFLSSMAKEPGIDETDRLLAVTTISFDIAGLELFLPLINGATLVLAEEVTAKDGRVLLEVLQKENISILQATPTTWQMLLEVGWEKPLPIKALCGGEALPDQLAGQLLERCKEVWNMYGPTETTIWSTIKQIRAEDPVVTIGKPIANTQIYLLGTENQLVVVPDEIGEICIAGDGVAQGYWKREQLASEKFIENTFAPEKSEKLYRTGDLGKLLPNGEILCLGRMDQQVKIRGHRIEPGEVEQALTSLDGVKAAVVLADSDSLVAHIVIASTIDSFDAQVKCWKDALMKSLPGHLIPKKINVIDAIPTTPNGKVDRKALLQPELTPSKTAEESRPALTPARTIREKLVATAFKECLGLKEVDIFSDFFELGGHSLIAVRVMTYLERETNKRLPLSSLFEHSTIEKLAKLLDENDKAISWGPLVPIKPNGSKAPLYIIHGAGLNLLKFHDLIKNLDDEQPVYGLQGIGLSSLDKPLQTVEQMASYYIETILKSNPDGPLALAGYSLGGIVAYEMARQLLDMGKELIMVGMLDTYIEPFYFTSSPLGQRIAKANFYKNWAIFDYKMMLRNGDYFRTRVKGKIKRVKGKFVKTQTKKAKNSIQNNHLDPELKEVVNKALTSYRFAPIECKIDLFRASEQTFYMHEPEKLGWNEIAISGVDVHHIPGNHSSIFSPPHVNETARVIQAVLDARN